MSKKNGLLSKLTWLPHEENWNNKLLKIIPVQLFWILAISAIVRLVYYSALLNTIAIDSASYLNYHANILKGQTDGLRTPVYPYFIKLIGLFGQQDLVNHVIVAQSVISFLSIIIFYKIVKACLTNRTVTFAATLLYGVMLPVINFDKLILTESLSVVCSLTFIYLIVGYLQKPGNIKAWLITLFVVIAIMLRPSFIYLLPLTLLFWLLRLLINKKDWKMCLQGLAAWVVVVLLLWGYSGLNEKNAGFNGISVVSNHNEMVVIINAGIYMYGNDPEISQTIKNNIQLQQKSKDYIVSGTNIMLKYDPDRIHKFITACIKNQPVVYVLHIGGKLIDLQTTNIFTNYADHKLNFLAFRVENVEYLMFCVTFNILYIFLAIDLVLILGEWFKRKQAPWFKIVLWLLVTGQIAVAIMGGYSEYQRLILPAMPALLIILFSCADKISFAIDKEKLKRYPVLV